MNSTFYDRRYAGKLLADRLSQVAWEKPGWVFALPRGGVPIGYEIARRLGWPMDIWLVRKLGAPNQPELAIGAIAAPNTQVLNHELIQRLRVTKEQLAATTRAEVEELQRRDRLYRHGKPLPQIKNMPIIVVDDGLATGATMQAAILALRKYRPTSLTIALPVAAASSLQQFSSLVDEVVCLEAPTAMGAISQWYVHFEAVSDQEVISLLEAQSPE